MPKFADNDEIQIEEEEDEAPYVEFDISVSPADPTLELLANKVRQGDIIVPFYQRRYVWRIEQASRLIESFLMGLPVPQVFLYVNEEDQLEVIDGQQRILSIAYFFEGYFGDADAQNKRRIFKLKGLSERSEYNEKSFSELLPRDQRRLKNTSLRAIHIKQIKPSFRNDSVFHIFERLNTGGTQLKPQEIRNAVYRGKIVECLRNLNNDENWLNILGIKRPDKSQKDVELVLRLFSLFEVSDQYEKPMLRYLNTQMEANRQFDSDRAFRFQERFPRVTKLVSDSLERPFRPKSTINSAMLEGVMVALLELDAISAEELRKRYAYLNDDQDFHNLYQRATTDTLTVRARIRRAKELLSDVTI